MSVSAHQSSAQDPITASTLAACLRLHAERQPQKTAYRFLRDGEVEGRRLTYCELDRAARSVAALLEQHSAIGDRVLLLFPQGLDFIIALCACFYSGRVAVPAYPPRPNRGTDRLIGIIQDAAPAAALTSSEVKTKALHHFVNDKAFQRLAVVTTDSASADASEEWEPVNLDSGMLALLQYTSGSTSIPKGVQVTHANLMHNEELIQKAFGQTEHDIVVGWLPLYHDMGLIGNVLQPLYCGAESILMPPTSFLQNPARWLAAISRYRATTSGGPNFAYEFCCNRITAEQKANLDLSSWRVAFSGAEPVRAQSLEHFATEFRDCGFRASAFVPCYGLAESTLFVTGGISSVGPVMQAVQADALERNQVIPTSTEEAGGRVLVGCGRAGAGHEVSIVDPERLTHCKPGTVGEIWACGPSVANGYWNRRQETANTFEARLANTGEGPYLRTGDLGFLLDGELFITGRRKDLIIIRGRNHYPHDLEATAEKAHPALRSCIGAAFSVEAEGEERLVLVQEINPQTQAETGTVIAALRQAIAEEHELQLYAVTLTRPGEIPRTTSGKIQRFLCRKAFLAGDLGILSEWRATFTAPDFERTGDGKPQIDDWQTWLILQLAHRLRIPLEMIEADQPPSRYGLDSLAAVELAHEIEQRAGILLPFADLISGLSITELAAALSWQKQLAAMGATVTAAPRRHNAARYPLSHGQRALFFLCQLDSQNSAYHIYQALRIASPLDEQAVARAFERLVRRHPALRTVFKLENGNPVQELQSTGDGPMLEVRPWHETKDQLLKQMAREARAPFDLESVPPVRCILFRTSEPENYLLFAIHHIISDLWSLSLFIKELAALYESEAGSNNLASLPPSELEYGDYVSWQADMLAGVEGERHWAYWREELAGELPVLNLPADHPRASVQTYRGAAHHFRCDVDSRSRLRRLASKNSTTLFNVLLSAWAVLLHRYSGQSEVLIGSPTAGRTHSAFRSVAGYFVNPVVIRVNIADDPVFETLLAQVRGKVLGALAHQDFPFPLLVEKLRPQRDPSRSPLFQALFAFQSEIAGTALGQFALGESGAVFETNVLRFESVPLGEDACQFDIVLQACEAKDELVLGLQYNADLFGPQTIERMAGNLRTLLGALDSSLRVSELPLLSPEDRLMLESWNLTKTSYPKALSLHQMIEAQVERTPDAGAVWFEGQILTYAELNIKANQLAHHLQSLGVQPESLVGICMERSFALVIGILGILKAGAAYVPFDPSYPAERLDFLLRDADVPVLLVEEPLRARFDSRRLIVTLDSECSTLQNENTANPTTSVSPDNLAYMIYTSGSTGNPKGAMNSHRAVCNLLQWAQEARPLDANDRVLQRLSFSFDASVWEFFWPLTAGASIVLASPGRHFDSTYLRDLINERQITTMYFNPSMLSVFLDEPGIELCVSLRHVFAGGEALPADLVRRFFARLNAELHNCYGPSEAGVEATSFVCSAVDSRRSIPIGTPHGNVQTYVLDSHYGLRPIGAVGELYIGGAGVGRGYHHHPELTAERFVPDLFGRHPGARIYKTGDLARYLPDGNIEFVGRNDHQVKIRGFRVELGEIEATLIRHSAVSQAVVIAQQAAAVARRPAHEQMPYERLRNERHQETASESITLMQPEVASDDEPLGSSVVRLVAYLVCSNPRPAIHDLRSFLRNSLPEYMIPAEFVFLDALPVSPSGKVDQRVLPEPDVTVRNSQAEYVAPVTPTEVLLAEIWSGVLGRPEIGVDDNFFELGGDSIRSLQVRARALQRGLEFTVQDIMRFQTIRDLAQHAGTAGPEQQLSLEPFELLSKADCSHMPADAEDAYPLSKVQTGLLYHVLYDPSSDLYHEIFFYQVRSPLNFDLFRQAVQESVDRHPILRTSFHLGEFSEPLQIVHRYATAHVERLDWRHLSAAEQQKSIREWTDEERRRVLHLQDTSLLRLFVHHLEDDVFQIVSSYNNILFDGWSEASLITELLKRYSSLLKDPLSLPLPGLSIKYRDFIALERATMLSGEALAYWEEALHDCVVQSLSTSARQMDAGANQIGTLEVRLPAGLLSRLDTLAAMAGASPKHVLLAGHIKVLSLVFEQQDLILGFQTNGRLERLDGDQVLGMHNMILPFRVKLSGGTWLDLVHQAFEAECDLLPHRRYPLVELQRTRRRQQLFDTVFNYTHLHAFQSLSALCGVEVLGAWGMERSHYTLRAEFSRNPLTRELRFDLNFNGSVIPIEQVRQIANCYTRVFHEMAEHPTVSHEVETLVSPFELGIVPRQTTDVVEPSAAEPTPIEAELKTQSVVLPKTTESANFSPMQELLASMWSHVLKKDHIDPDENFFTSGGDSLLATQLMLYIRARLKIDLPLRILFEEAPTLRTFAGKVDAALRREAGLSRPPIEPVPRFQAPALSFAQRRLWFIEHLEPAVYHMPAAIRVKGPLNHQALERSFNEIVRRHESLRTTFHLVDTEPVQRIAKSLEISIPVVDLSSSAAQEREAELKRFIQTEVRRPFTLETGPLMCVSVVRMSEEENVLLAILHHIISDGWSAGVLIAEMVPLYEAFVTGQPSPLPELTVQYADFAAWQQGWLHGPLFEQQITYWRNKLKGPLPVLGLPEDFPRPKSPRGDGSLLATSVPPELVQQLRLLSNREGCTLFMTLLSAFYVLLHAKTRQEDLIVGTDLANRSSIETEKMIGFFVNQAALRADLSGDPGFTDLLSRVRTMTTEAYVHQDVPFDRVVEAVNPQREINRTPLFQVKFVLQNVPRPKLEVENLRLVELELGSGTAKFDLLINVLQKDGALHMLWEYSSEIFRESTVQRMADCYLALLENIVLDPELRLHAAVAVVQKTDQSIREKAEQKRNRRLREKLVQKSRKALE
jgi:amino acid adenylation domain-containing protein